MSLIEGLQLPFGIQPVNPTPVNTWEGPYSSVSDAINIIPNGVRYLTMEVSILDSVAGNQKYWFKDGVADSDLVAFSVDLTYIDNEITGLTKNKYDITGGTVYGYVTSSGFTGSGMGLFDIPASGITGLNLDRIMSELNSAIISSSGLTVNTGITGVEFIKSGGTSTQFLKADGSVDSSNYSINPISTIPNNIPLFGDTSGSTLIDSGVNLGNFVQIPIDVIYSELTTLITNSQLIIGQKYLLTDYATTYTQPISNASLSGNTEPLLLAASSSNTLNPICSSALFPQDQIYYNVVNDTSVVPGCTKGYIYRRIDTQKKNDIGFDYRQVKFRRWKLNVTTTDATGVVGVFGVGSVVNKTGTSEIYLKINNTSALFTVTSSWKRFEFDNLTYSSYSQYNWVVDNYNYSIPVSSDYMDYYMFSTNNTVNGAQSAYTNIYNNIFAGNTSTILTNNNSIFFGSTINDNTINSYFVNNTIGNSFTNNIIGMLFRYNSINSNFSFNNIKQLFYYNSIGNYFYLNNTDNYFYSNVVGDTCQYNNIGELSNKNKIGNSFTNNNIDVYFYSNLIGNYLSYNKIGRYFYSNTLLGNVYFQSNSIGNYFNTNNIGGYFQYNTCGDNFSNNTNEWESKYNTFGINFSYNYIQEVWRCTIGDNVRYNNISNSSGYFFSYNTIGNNVGGTSLIRKDLGNVTELVSKTYNHQITQTENKVKIEWADVYGDINIIRL